MRSGSIAQTHAVLTLMKALQSAKFIRLASRENAVHKAADSFVDSFTVTIEYAFAKGRKYDTPGAAAQAVKYALLDVLPDALLPVLEAGGNAGLTLLGRQINGLRAAADKPFKMLFDVTDARAIKWAQKHAAELAKGISDTTRDDIKEAIAAGLEAEFTRAEVIKAIRAAVGDKVRAEMIARTETMHAANEGQRQAWQQAVAKGLLTGNEKRTWIATEDACPLCSALDGETTGLDGEYPDGGDGPPLHPRCRCTEGIVS